jgi:hypothetical protein
MLLNLYDILKFRASGKVIKIEKIIEKED